MVRDGGDSTDVGRLVARLRFRHLRLLVELSRTGSLRAAASVLNQTQPALSKALHEVESAFGFALFTRTPRGLDATPRGEIAIRGAASLLAELAHVAGETATDPAMTVLRVGAPPFVAQGYLPAVFARAARGGMPARIHLTEERVPLLTSLLLAGRLDALVSSHPTELPDEQRPALRYEKLFEAKFVVIAPARHPLSGARRVSWDQLAAQPWIMPGRTSMVDRMVDDMFRRHHLPTPRPAVESTSPVTNCRLVAAGLGVAAVPAAILEDRPDNDVRVLAVSPGLPLAPVSLISRADSANPRVALIREMLGPSVRGRR